MAPRHIPEGSQEEDYFICGQLVSVWGTSDSEKGIRQEVSHVTTSFKRRFTLKISCNVLFILSTSPRMIHTMEFPIYIKSLRELSR